MPLMEISEQEEVGRWESVDWVEHPAALIGFFALIIVGMLCIMALIAVPARAETATTFDLVSVEDMREGGLFLPSEHPGQVIAATTIETKIEIAVTGLLARATVHQSFVNPTDAWAEAVYVFPLPEAKSSGVKKPARPMRPPWKKAGRQACWISSVRTCSPPL